MSPKRILIQIVFLILGLVSLYYLLPQILDVFAQAPNLGELKWRWFFLMALLVTLSFMSAWQLTRIAVPGVSMFVAGTAQLTSNAVSRVVPGGAVVGGALYYQMLSVSGVHAGVAAAALAAVSFISTLVLLALPGVAVAAAAVSAPIPDGLLPVALAGTVLFLLMFGAAVVLVVFDRPLRFIGQVAQKVVAWAAKRFHRSWAIRPESLLDRRNEVVQALGRRWRGALSFAVLNWLFDYLALVVALTAVGAEPRVSLVLLAFAASAVLGMIPITPGGLGFVEAGLTATLVIAGIPSGDALLATLAYRLFQFWLPIPAGAIAYLLFRRSYGRPADLQEAT
jgi:hypothetical protein